MRIDRTVPTGVTTAGQVDGEPAKRARASTTAGVHDVSSFDPVQAPKVSAKPPPPPPPAPKSKSFWDKVGDFFSGAASRIGDAVGGFFSGVGTSIAGAVQNVWEGTKTFFGGIGELFQGKFGEGFKDMGLGLLKTFVQTPLDAAAVFLVKTVSSIQTLIGVEPVGRKLTGAEIAALRQVYGDSIDYSKVEIKEGKSGLLSLSGRAFTMGNTIYIPESPAPLATLVHEMGHVWQNQHGGTDYISESLWAQYGPGGHAYDWKTGIAEGKSWDELDPEQQAELISEAWSAGFFANPNQPYMVGGTDYGPYLRKAVEELRAGRGAP